MKQKNVTAKPVWLIVNRIGEPIKIGGADRRETRDLMTFKQLDKWVANEVRYVPSSRSAEGRAEKYRRALRKIFKMDGGHTSIGPSEIGRIAHRALQREERK